MGRLTDFANFVTNLKDAFSTPEDKAKTEEGSKRREASYKYVWPNYKVDFDTIELSKPDIGEGEVADFQEIKAIEVRLSTFVRKRIAGKWSKTKITVSFHTIDNEESLRAGKHEAFQMLLTSVYKALLSDDGFIWELDIESQESELSRMGIEEELFVDESWFNRAKTGHYNNLWLDPRSFQTNSGYVTSIDPYFTTSTSNL